MRVCVSGHDSLVVTIDVTQLQLDLRSTEVEAMSEEEEGGHQGDDDPCECHQWRA